jgi:hypothetical protein
LSLVHPPEAGVISFSNSRNRRLTIVHFSNLGWHPRWRADGSQAPTTTIDRAKIRTKILNVQQACVE